MNSKAKPLVLMLAFLSITAFAQWSTDHAQNLKLTNLPGEQVIPKVAKSPDGSYYVSYFSLENGNYNVRLQRLSTQGQLLWQDNGVLVSSHPSMTWLTDWDMTADANNHAVLVWQDIRTGNNQIVVYRISPQGEFVWGSDGILLSNNSGFNVSPKVAALADGSIVVAWQSSNVIYRQKLNPDGQKLWGENGIVLSGTGTFSWPQLFPSGDSEVFMKYFIDTGPSWAPTRKMYVHKFNAQGAQAWMSPVEIFNLGSITAWTQILPMISDGFGGFYITWHDYSFNQNAATPRINHVRSNGQMPWQANGLPLSLLHTSNQFDPMPFKISGLEGVYALWWEQNMDQNLWGVFAQKTNPAGEMLWTQSGKELIPVTTQYVRPLHVEAESDGFVLFFEHGYSTTTSALKAMRFNSMGDSVWTQSAFISSTVSGKGKTVFAPFANGQWVIAWEDDRSGNIDIYAQNMKADGSLGPIPPTAVGNIFTKTSPSIQIFPHPAGPNSRIIIQRAADTPALVSIRDLSGRKIYETKLDFQQMGNVILRDLLKGTPLKNGVYILQFVQNDFQQNERFIYAE